MSFKDKVLAGTAGILSVGAIDVNWTELEEVFGELMDLLVAIVQDLPNVVINIAVVLIILIVVGFIASLFKRLVGMIKIP